MRSIFYFVMIVCFVALSFAGCGGSLTAPNEPPPGVSLKSVPAVDSATLLASAASAKSRGIGIDRFSESETAVDSLGRIGPASLPALVELLHGQDEDLRVAAARAIAIMGPEAKEAVTDLTAALSDPSPTVRKQVLRALGQMGPAAEGAIDALVKEARRDESPLDKQIDRDRPSSKPRPSAGPAIRPATNEMN